MPLGLDPPSRQIALLQGLARRCREGTRQFMERVAAQAFEVQSLQASHVKTWNEQQRAQVQIRFDRLLNIDQQDESASAIYERGTFIARKERGEVRSKIQKQRRAERKQIQEECQKRRQAALEQFEKTKDEPEKFRVRQKQRADQALRPLSQLVIDAQELALRRLGSPELGNVTSAAEPLRFSSLSAAFEAINQNQEQAKSALRTAELAPNRRWTEGVGMLIAGFVGALIWLGIIFLIHPEPFIVWLLGALPAGGFGSFATSLVFNPGVKWHTREWLPRVIEQVEAAKSASRSIAELAKNEAADMAAAIAKKRDDALKQADEWRARELDSLEKRMDQMLADATDALNRQLISLEKKYRESQNHFTTQTKEIIDQWTSDTRQANQLLQQQQNAGRQQQIKLHEQQRQDIATRVRNGLQRGLARIGESSERFQQRFPEWSRIVEADYHGQLPLGRIPIGLLNIHDYLVEQLKGPPESSTESISHSKRSGPQPVQLDVASFLPEPLPSQLPVTSIVGQHAGVLIECPSAQIESARRLVQTLILRIIGAAPAGKVRLLFLDPVGRGQSFAPLMSLADHDPQLVTHRAWAGPEQIDARLSELTQHMEDILQTYLRDRFATIDEYNALAGSMAEPYRIIAAIGFPAGLTSASAEHLRALLDGGPRCGIMTILVIDPQTPWPNDLAPLSLNRFLRLQLDEQGKWKHHSPLLRDLPLAVVMSPPPAIQSSLLEKIGTEAANADRVVIPFTEITKRNCDGEGSTADGVAVPIGRQGVGKTIEMELGEGVRQHVLIAGKTGSGKSSLLHTIITASALRFTPEQLQMYLLDFKKGVEFKLYADVHLPHARVIGIESEREFGRSVLERLDGELHRRGEMFRAVGVQELGEYRRRTGNDLPRLLLIVDEFQELFVRDDRIAQDCTMLLDRLVRQGRSFGVHTILASQSLAGAYSLPRNTLGQMAVRIALQCSESDAGLILSDDNTAARLLSRPGEAIYNDASGLVEGNQPFQVAWLDHEVHETTLRPLATRYAHTDERYGPPVVFEGNRPATWNGTAIELALQVARGKSESPLEICGVVGESVAIGPPVSVRLSRQAGRNLLIVTAENSLVRDVLGTLLPSFAANAQGKLSISYFAGRPDAVEDTVVLQALRATLGDYQFVRPRDAEATIVKIAEEVKRRVELGDDHPHSPQLIVIEPLERFRDLRQDESLAYSFDANKPPGPDALATILRDGPAVGVHAILCCGSAEAFSRWIARGNHHDLELRVLGRLNTNDAALLSDSSEAAALGPASMLVYDESMGRIEKLRVYNLPDQQQLIHWLNSKQPSPT